MYGRHVIQPTWAPVKAYLFLEHLSGLHFEKRVGLCLFKPQSFA